MRYQTFIETLIAQQSLRESDLNRVNKIKEQMQETGLPLLLVKLGLCSEKDVAAALAVTTGLGVVAVEDYPDAAILPEGISLRFLKEFHAVGIATEEGTNKVVVAVMDPENSFIEQSLRLVCDTDIEVKIGLLSDIDKAIERQYGDGKSQMGQITDNLDASESLDDIEHLKDLASEAPVIRMVNLIFQRALENKASDIHFEPFEDSLIIRLRIDGVLQKIEGPPVSATAAVISRIKLMAKLNIAERRLPQDGRIKMTLSRNKAIDFRVNTCPTLFGEKVVLRILDPTSAQLGIEKLGFEPEQQTLFLDAIKKPYGMILVTGPTGSGKTVSLYTGLNILNTVERNISTAEDPVEITVEGINQVNMNVKAGLTFATALRAFLRQDPDIIMVGEIRDLETAEIAVKAAQTGHMVLSTLHTNDAPQTLNRLLQMGIPAFNIVSSVLLIMAQRLARRLCEHCKATIDYPELTLQEAGFKEEEIGTFTVYTAVGCDRCNGGYKGRVGIYQVMPLSEAMRSRILEGCNAMELADQAKLDGINDLRRSGLLKIIQGITTLEEIDRVTRE